MKSKFKIKTMIKLWRENRLDQEWQITTQDLAKGFIESEYHKRYLDGMLLERCIRGYVTASDGLNSVFEEKDFDEIFKSVRNSIELNSKMGDEIEKLKKEIEGLKEENEQLNKDLDSAQEKYNDAVGI